MCFNWGEKVLCFLGLLKNQKSFFCLTFSKRHNKAAYPHSFFLSLTSEGGGAPSFFSFFLKGAFFPPYSTFFFFAKFIGKKK